MCMCIATCAGCICMCVRSIAHDEEALAARLAQQPRDLPPPKYTAPFGKQVSTRTHAHTDTHTCDLKSGPKYHA